jgi:hypothetical protein
VVTVQGYREGSDTTEILVREIRSRERRFSSGRAAFPFSAAVARKEKGSACSGLGLTVPSCHERATEQTLQLSSAAASHALFDSFHVYSQPVSRIRASPAGRRTNGSFCSVCVEARTENGSRFGPPSRRTQRADASCLCCFLFFSNLNANESRRELK